MTTAYGYCRISTAEQAESGLGLEWQRQVITAECERRGWHLAGVYEEPGGASARNLKRPGLLDALRALTAGDVLMAARLDRISRSVIDFASLMQRAERQGWSICVLDVALDTSTPSGEMMAGIVSVFSQYERKLIGARTKAALSAKKARGARLGRPVQLAEVTRQQVVALRATGASFQAIADRLNVEGVPTAQPGARWHAATVQRTVRSVELDAEARKSALTA